MLIEDTGRCGDIAHQECSPESESWNLLEPEWTRPSSMRLDACSGG